MQQKQNHILLVLLTILALTLSACGSSASNASVIATSVAMTVQAQNTQQIQTNPVPPTLSDVPTISLSSAPTATKAPPTAPIPGTPANHLCTASASITDGNYPDGTIVGSGAVFTKHWNITNTGTCPWDSTWKLVFSSGDVMGGAYVYNFPQPATPGQTVDVPVVFTAPVANGQYTGNWKLQSPWGTSFATFWVQIVVGTGTPGKGTATAFQVTSVTYDVTHTGICTDANMFFTITATISTNGPLKIAYHWLHEDGGKSGPGTLNFTEASTKFVSETLSWRITSTNKQHSDKIILTSPYYQEFDPPAYYSRNCQ